MKSRGIQLEHSIAATPNGALFSQDRKHRFVLWRTWNGPEKLMLFVGLNPSKADEQRDDPTIRRCIGFAKRERATGILVTNLFSLRATDPRELLASNKPISEGNASAICAARSLARVTVVCWGALGAHLGRSSQVLPELGAVLCFGTTKLGEPKHPLYLRGDTKLRWLDKRGQSTFSLPARL